jgi:hypothetical protein
VTPEAGLNSELLQQKSKEHYIGQFLLMKVCNNYSFIHKFLINHILLQAVLIINSMVAGSLWQWWKVMWNIH